MFRMLRTGVRLVMTNPADPRRVEDYAAWYDAYASALTGPGFLANAFRFENSAAAGTEDDPRFVAVYDIVTSDPAIAWPQTVGSPQYPTPMFDDPRSTLVAPAFRASYALVGSQDSGADSGPLSGVHIALTDGGDDTGRQQWAARVLGTGQFYAASRFRLIEGFPDPAEWLEIWETDQPDPRAAYTGALRALGPELPDDAVRSRRGADFHLVNAYQPARPPSNAEIGRWHCAQQADQCGGGGDRQQPGDRKGHCSGTGPPGGDRVRHRQDGAARNAPTARDHR
jgi:hypothetical protein